MTKLVTIVGARPQFVKAAIVSRSFARLPHVDERIVHTGQHYDHKMSQVFFDELSIPRPSYNLEAGSGSHGKQTGYMLQRIEEILLDERPDAVVVYGDTNSTLAGALASIKLHIPVAHVEAGLRSWNMRMPEEVNRIVTDRISELLLCPTAEAVRNLQNEGVTAGVHLVGDVMYDAALFFSERAETLVGALAGYGLRERNYVLMTCHRAENTDDPGRLANIIEAAGRVAAEMPVLFPVHPRTRKMIEGKSLPTQLQLVEPVSYLEMLVLERKAALILTDSGGVQKEAFFFGVPCVTMRDQTEWVETVENGANVLVGADSNRIYEAALTQLGRTDAIPSADEIYGGNKASERTAQQIQEMALSVKL